MAQNADDLGIPLSGPGSLYFRPEVQNLKVIGVEEHTTFPAITSQFPDNDVTNHVKSLFGGLSEHKMFDYTRTRLADLDEKRIEDMNDGGISMQILSFAAMINTTAVDDSQLSAKIAGQVNDGLYAAVKQHPDRFAAFAELPVHWPDLAIDELRRCVSELGFVGAMLSGSIGDGKDWLDSPRYDKLLSTFEELDVPLFLHPGMPPKPIVDNYYRFDDNPGLTGMLSGPGWGWHNDVAVHVLRLAVSGALDRHPRLKLIIGHQGEMMPMMLQRFDTMFDAKPFGLKRSVGEALRSQVWLALSGMFSIPPTLIAIQTWGSDRVLFANDYPFIDSHRVQPFLKALGDVVSPSDLRKICHTNAETLLKLRS